MLGRAAAQGFDFFFFHIGIFHRLSGTPVQAFHFINSPCRGTGSSKNLWYSAQCYVAAGSVLFSRSSRLTNGSSSTNKLYSSDFRVAGR